MSWLAEAKTDLAAERILDAAGALFVERGVGKPGMDEVARAAGCSRATLYRYFENRQVLIQAFAHREARLITAQVARATAAVPDPRCRLVEAVLVCLAAVRERPHLQAWYAGDSTLLREVLHESSVIRGSAQTYLAPDAEGSDPDLVDWVLRIILSFLTDPGDDEEAERRLLERFLPGTASAPQRNE
ncbi:TetR/AcrR family transcriptional regulator [Nocardioides panzhihuensis]|uniref:AcrR family transcriptional regulator n=1 Tax=Nocardioides panzhihuensis TaxID=860243 RepID=A0A7Z0IUT2_9ACTN|nr:TetR/AcrR family transcriptional regulator [Nocardioides panzhihuensis]NYI80272.1 AcrR family transcriptional regulator [Nocardioides panzhihuensis]